MANRFAKGKKCEMCANRGPRFAYDGFMLCSDCKSDMTRSDNQNRNNRGGHAVQGCFSQGMRRR